jgi:hypothetical protein
MMHAQITLGCIMSVVFPINEDERYRQFVATAGQTVFAIAFPFQDKADVTIEKIDLAGARTVLTYPANYSINGEGSPSGGSFTLTVPALAGEKYRPIGDAILDRLTSVVRGGRFSSGAIDSDLDRNRIIQQEQARDINRSLKVDFGIPPLDYLPPAQPGKVLGWNDAGTGLANKELLTTGTAIFGEAGLAIFGMDVPATVRDYLDAKVYVADRPKLKGLDPTKDKLAEIWNEGGRNGTFSPRLVSLLSASEIAARAADAQEGIYINSTANPLYVWLRIIDGAYNVRWFGAKGDGSTNDTVAIATADALSRLNKVQAYFPGGTYMVRQMVVYTSSDWFGDGKNTTTVKQIIGSNTDLVYGVNSNANWGVDGSVAVGFPYDFSIEGMTFDGNWNAGAGNTSGSGIAIYGDHYNVRDVYIKNIAEHGFRKEFVGDSPINYDSRFLESSFETIRVDYVGKDGFWDKGPHDSHHRDIIVLDAGQSADNTYDGFRFSAGSSARNVAIHAATRSGRLRMKYSVHGEPGSAHEFSGGCNIEGATTANLGLFSSGWMFDPSTRFYAAWNGVNILLGGTNCSLNIIRGNLQGPPAGRPACVGIQFSTVAGDHVNDNDIDVMMAAQNAGLVAFTAQNSGSNKIRVKCFNTANVGITGTPTNLDDVLVRGSINNGSHYEVNTLDQTAFVASIPAGASTIWTFPYGFRVSPNVQVSIGIPASAATLPLWINSLSPTAVSIFNPNANAMPAFVSAKGVY